MTVGSDFFDGLVTATVAKFFFRTPLGAGGTGLQNFKVVTFGGDGALFNVGTKTAYIGFFACLGAGGIFGDFFGVGVLVTFDRLFLHNVTAFGAGTADHPLGSAGSLGNGFAGVFVVTFFTASGKG